MFFLLFTVRMYKLPSSIRLPNHAIRDVLSTRSVKITAPPHVFLARTPCTMMCDGDVPFDRMDGPANWVSHCLGLWASPIKTKNPPSPPLCGSLQLGQCYWLTKSYLSLLPPPPSSPAMTSAAKRTTPSPLVLERGNVLIYNLALHLTASWRR